MDSPGDVDSKQNSTFSTSDDKLGLFQVEMERQISGIQNLITSMSRFQHFMRDEYEDETKLLQSRLADLQRVTAMQIDYSRARKEQSDADFKRLEMKIKSMQGNITELTRSITRSEGQRTERAWVPTSGAGYNHHQDSAPMMRSNSLDSIHNVHVPLSTRCIQLNSFEKRRNEVLAKYGVLKTPQKKMMLEKWRSQRGSNDNLVRDLLLKTSRFLIDSSPDLLEEDELFEQVIDQIPDDDWLKFARTELRLTESEIREVKQTCEPTDEQLYQLSLEGGTEE